MILGFTFTINRTCFVRRQGRLPRKTYRGEKKGILEGNFRVPLPTRKKKPPDHPAALNFKYDRWRDYLAFSSFLIFFTK